MLNSTGTVAATGLDVVVLTVQALLVLVGGASLLMIARLHKWD